MTTSGTTELHWFEKTVEYAFVIQYASQLAQAIPLDGNHEQAGDSIFQLEDARWILIEFKRYLSSLGSEADKFDDFAEASKNLKEKGSDLHFLVYGSAGEKKSLDLSAALYWEIETPLEISQMIKKGINNRQDFFEYITSVVELKKKKSSGGGGGPDFSCVAAIGKDGKVKALGSVEEYLARPNAAPSSRNNFRI